jgi:hypothetical protein
MMKDDQILILKGNFNAFERYYLEHMNRPAVQARTYYKETGIFQILRKVHTHSGLPLDSIWYGDWKQELKRYDKIIIFDCIPNARMAKYIRRKAKKGARVILWFWNPLLDCVSKKLYEQTKGLCEQWTFDSADAGKYGMNLNNQFFFRQDTVSAAIEYDVLFVGKDKGRYHEIKRLKDLLDRNGICSYLKVVRDETTPSDAAADVVLDKGMSYESLLELSKKSRCILELCQEGQHGITVRTLEAMFYCKKLITNNKNIQQEALYDPDRIYLYPGDSEKLVRFIQADSSKTEIRNLDRYTFEGWLKNFDRNLNLISDRVGGLDT